MGCGIVYEIYTMKFGEGINDILGNFNISMEELIKINGVIDLNNLKEGMQIIVPVIGNNPYQYYTVKKGDTISSIANKYDVDTMLVTKINGLDSNDYIYPNQTLIVPRKGFDLYLTNSDDTINSVLRKKDVTLEELIKNNENIYLREEQILVFLDK